MYTVLSLINISKYMHYSDFKVCKYNNYKYYAELKARQLVTLCTIDQLFIDYC